MTDPPHVVDLRDGLSLQRQARVVEGKPGEENLVFSRQGHDPGALIHLQALQIVKTARGIGLHRHLARVNTEPVPQLVLAASVPKVQPGLEAQREAHRIRRAPKRQEEGITRGTDFNALGEFAQQCANELVVLIDELEGFEVT